MTCAAFLADGKLLVSGFKDQTVRLWDVNTAAMITALSMWIGRRSLAFSPDSRTIGITSVTDFQIRQADTHEIVFSYTETEAFRVGSISTDGSRLDSDRGDRAIPRCFHSDSAANKPQNDARALFVAEKWLTRNLENLLWLPLEYRECPIAVRQNKIAIGTNAGIILNIGFNFQKGPLWV